jgi:tRNA pseudouridine32 synthase/23S rRNA pseudouridine746 synthase
MIPPPILFADARFVVLDKPAGLPSHRVRRGGESIEDCFPALSRRSTGPWLAHRLDTDTAGCLLVALRRAALLEAQAAFTAGQVRKTYWAVVRGRPYGQSSTGTVDMALRKVSDGRGWRMAGGTEGQSAVTDWEVRGAGDGMTWLELRPRTGRTHQVRVHCLALGCPVVGDVTYGDVAGPMHLLARDLFVPLEPPVTAQAPVPAHMRAAMLACGWDAAVP